MSDWRHLLPAAADHSRVVLPTTNGNPLSDYINGNFINVSVHKYVLYIHRYICVYMNKCACVYVCTVHTYIDTCTLSCDM